jgi:hypothetical protein
MDFADHRIAGDSLAEAKRDLCCAVTFFPKLLECFNPLIRPGHFWPSLDFTMNFYHYNPYLPLRQTNRQRISNRHRWNATSRSSMAHYYNKQ